MKCASIIISPQIFHNDIHILFVLELVNVYDNLYIYEDQAYGKMGLIIFIFGSRKRLRRYLDRA